jgi:hypothetical protein
MKNSVPALIYANRERNPRAAAGAMARAVRTGREKCSSRNPNVRGGNSIREMQSDSRGEAQMQFLTGRERNPKKKGSGTESATQNGEPVKSKNCKKQREWVKADE